MLDFDDELTIYFSDDFQDASTPTISNDSTQTDTDILLQLSESDESYVFSQETVSSDDDKEENPHRYACLTIAPVNQMLKLLHMLNSATIRRLEDVITGLLSQISDAMSAYDGSPCSGGKIKLELVDRRKPLKTDGYAYIYSDHSMSYIFYSGHSAHVLLPTRTTHDTPVPSLLVCILLCVYVCFIVDFRAAQVLRVMDLMHEALCNDTPTTKRYDS